MLFHVMSKVITSITMFKSSTMLQNIISITQKRPVTHYLCVWRFEPDIDITMHVTQSRIFSLLIVDWYIQMTVLTILRQWPAYKRLKDSEFWMKYWRNISWALDISTNLNIPSVCAPFKRSTSSDNTVCIHGNRLSGYLSFCIAMISSKVLPNMDGWKMDF